MPASAAKPRVSGSPAFAARREPRRLRIGLFGFDEARRQIAAVQSSPFWRIEGIGGRRLADARHLQAEFDLPPPCEDIADLLSRHSLDAVWLGEVSAPALRRQVAASLAAGVSVLCMAPLIAGRAPLLPGLEKHGRTHRDGPILLSACTLRHAPELRRQRELFAAGVLGKLRACEITLGISGDAARGGRQELTDDLQLKALDLALWYAKGAKCVDQIGDTELLLEGRDGVAVRLRISEEDSAPRVTCRLEGSSGSDETVWGEHSSRTRDSGLLHPGQAERPHPRQLEQQALLEHFARCLFLDGAPIGGVEEAFALLALVRSLRAGGLRSSRGGRT